MAAAMSLAATTMEGQLLELVGLMQAKESDAESNPQNANRITGTYNSDTSVFSGTFTLSVTQTIDSNGKIVLTASTYLN
jgi:hypothetical protein